MSEQWSDGRAQAGGEGHENRPVPGEQAKDLAPLRQQLGVAQWDEALVRAALVHRSFAYEHGDKGPNQAERLEFLGDAVLELIITRTLFLRFPQWPEGTLTRARARLVARPALARQARKIGLAEYIYLGRGEEASGGRNRDALLADTLEALLGAVYLSGGLAAAEGVVLRLWQEELRGLVQASHQGLASAVLGKDAKGRLQEFLQAQGLPLPEYRLLAVDGPVHDRVFHVGVWVQGEMLGAGQGRSKREASKLAAAAALEKIRGRSGAGRPAPAEGSAPVDGSAAAGGPDPAGCTAARIP
ncbi:MAG: ribonuclease III [Firmicutes bacterium]|nr:ribonuclease III [Bacillota bacterium]